MSKRLDDHNANLIDLDRRIDHVRTDLNKRIDATNKRIDSVRTEIIARINAVRTEMITRIDATNERMDRLYDVIVKREEHEDLRRSFHDLNQRVQSLEEKVMVM